MIYFPFISLYSLQFHNPNAPLIFQTMAISSLDKSPPAEAAGNDELPPSLCNSPRRRKRSARRYDASPPPPPPPLRGDRDRDKDRDTVRDYKRRRSPNSPPPYRHRHYSPPPSFKRSRRGSPRGGYGHDDRFGYGYNSGYQHGMGGRPGYADEKPHGRYRPMGVYQHGPPDLETNNGGYADSSNRGSTQRGGLMSYKQFILELEDDILPSEAERRYQEYRSEYISTQKLTFFNSHRDEEWLKNKYHPTNLLAVIERRNKCAQQLAKDFLLDLQNGMLDLSPGVTSLASKSEQALEKNSGDEVETGGKQRQQVGCQAEGDISSAPKAHPFSSDSRRMQADTEQAKALICKLDNEKGVQDNSLCNFDYSKMDSEQPCGGSVGPIVLIRGLMSVKGLDGVELLDTLITYLWRIHGVDYYGMRETHEAKGFRHVRSEAKSREERTEPSAEWEKKFNLHWQDRLRGHNLLEVMTAKEKIDAAAGELLEPHIRKIKDEKYGWKYGCGAKGCTKLFHAAEFVHKHLKLKHPDLVTELTSKLREDIYFDNYINDPHAPGGTPVMQPSQKDRSNYRMSLANQLRDDRGGRRDHVIGGVDNSSDDQQSKAGNLDECDVYGGQDVGAISPFPLDVPHPPVLMPVPGAGPLGPFVPAPPEVARQILREQGGPASYDGSSRRMHAGANNGGHAPVIAVSPAFRQDPRRLRSYQDLDAPKDEVTVIDYRSL